MRKEDRRERRGGKGEAKGGLRHRTRVSRRELLLFAIRAVPRRAAQGRGEKQRVWAMAETEDKNRPGFKGKSGTHTLVGA